MQTYGVKYGDDWGLGGSIEWMLTGARLALPADQVKVINRDSGVIMFYCKSAEFLSAFKTYLSNFNLTVLELDGETAPTATIAGFVRPETDCTIPLCDRMKGSK